jgi:hypothetical protein
MVGLFWLARVGPASFEAWGAAGGWNRSTTYRHASRLVAAGWAATQPTTRGEGSLIYATRDGVAVSQARASALAAPPAPTTWAHCEACGWVAAWLTVRGRHLIGPRELLAGEDWQGQLRWSERGTVRTRGHRPDLLAAMSDTGPLMPVEVELATKSLARLQAVLSLHARWITAGKARALVYVCGTEYLADRVREHALPIGLAEERRTLRIELLDTIKQAALPASTQQPGRVG